MQEAVSPASACATARGLGQSGDTARDGMLWRGEELAGEMQEEDARQEEIGEEVEEAEEEEAEVAKTRRAPKGPTKKEREEHEATHIPYRDWCKHCVRGRANNRPHRGKQQGDEETEQRKVPRIAMDYFFMAQEGDRAAEYPMIVMIDESTDNRYMRAVGKKGLGENGEMEWLIKDMNDELKSWGYTGGPEEELIFKSDGERSIKAVRDTLSRYHGGKITPEQPPPGESQENGRVEEARKTLRGYIRVFKDMMESKLGEQIPADAAVLQWLVRWVAMLHSRYRRGTDGKTAYERQRGRKCSLEVIPFGEFVHYRKLGTDDRKNKLESAWAEGIWLGHARGSSEALIGAADGVVRARAVKRKPEEERWNASVVLSVQGTPARPNPQQPGNDIPVHINITLPDMDDLPPEPPPARVESEPRRTYLKARDFCKHGWTAGCEGCRRLKAGNMGARPHTEECRRRMEAILKEEGDPRWVRAKERGDERVWAEIKKQEAQAEEERSHAKKRKQEQQQPEQRQEEEKEQHPGSSGAASSGGPAEAQGRDQQGPRVAESSRAPPVAAGEGKRPPEAAPGEVDERKEDKKPRTEEAQGIKRENPEPRSEEEISRHMPRRRTDMDPMNTDLVQALLRVDVAEAFSPPRVTEEAKKFGLAAGEAMDLSTGWDFTRERDRQRARQYVEEHMPRLLIGSPPCTMFSTLQRMTPWSHRKQNKWLAHKKHVEFVVELYRIQQSAGRLFLHEHPENATSWKMEDMREISRAEGVYTVKADQCMFGLTTQGARVGATCPARKRTTFVTNSYHVARELDRACDGTHTHQPLVSGRAKAAERYPPALCRAICRGLIKDSRSTACQVRAVAEVSPPGVRARRPDPNAFHEIVEQQVRQIGECDSGGAWDDVTGMPLDRQKVQRARAEEIEYVRSKKVWTKIPRAEAQKMGYKIIKTRWIDINKGDDANPLYRSRFVAKEYNTGEEQGLFAGTPPLEALRFLIHDAATVGSGQKVVMINDVARAFFEARVKRKVCIEIPAEDLNDGDVGKDLVGLLNMSLYGTRDAAKNWQEEVAVTMKAWGFVQGVYNPCLYYHPTWNIRTLVHGDDFISTGMREKVMMFKVALENRFKLKTQIIGEGYGEVREARVLNRILRTTSTGWEYEPDQRHVDMLINGLGLQQAKGVATPGEDEKKWEEEENEQHLATDKIRQFRGYAARLNYLAPDRPDIAYSVKELCRSMAIPTVGAWKKLKRVVRYLVGARRSVMVYPWQGAEVDVETYSDSDWAGCRRSGKSTSGGAVTIGEHFIKGWSSTQTGIALSSAEAELIAMTKATAETMGVVSMIQDLGCNVKGIVYADSSAALAIADRKGSGKLRHINIRQLWIQEKQRKDEIELRKIKGTMNPADLMTKYLTSNRTSDLARRLGQRVLEGRANIALDLQGGGRAKACEYQTSGTDSTGACG